MSRFTRWWVGSALLILLGWHLSPELGIPLRRHADTGREIASMRVLPDPAPLDEADLLRVREVRLAMDEERFDFLFSHPPLSFNSFQDVRAVFDNRKKALRGRFRIRGGHSWHWLREKPSFRLRFPPRRKVWNRETLDFINPEDAALQANLLADFLAHRLGIPAAVTRYASVWLNERYLGLYHFTDRLDDRVFERIGRPRQPIAEGNRRRAEMWRDPGLWDIHSGQPAAGEACRKALTDLLASVRPPVADEGVRDLGRRIDLGALASWSALLTVIGSLQADDVHNQDLAYNTATGRFAPLLVDSTGFGALTNHGLEFTPVDSRIWPNEFLTPITNAAFRNPAFLAARNRAIWEFLQGEADPKRIASLAGQLFQAVKPHLAADRNRGALVNIPHLEFPLRLPTSAETVASAVAALSNWYFSRSTYLQELLSTGEVALHPITRAPGVTERLLWVEVSGHVPVVWDLATFTASIRFDDDRDRSVAGDSPRAPETLRLFPGLREGLPADQPWLRLESRLFPFALLPASQGYLLGIDVGAWDACLARLSGNARNGITGAAFPVSLGSELPEPPAYPVTAGLHPWSLDPAAMVP